MLGLGQVAIQRSRHVLELGFQVVVGHVALRIEGAFLHVDKEGQVTLHSRHVRLPQPLNGVLGPAKGLS